MAITIPSGVARTVLRLSRRWEGARRKVGAEVCFSRSALCPAGAGAPGALGGPEQGACGNQAQDEVLDGYPSAPP